MSVRWSPREMASNISPPRFTVRTAMATRRPHSPIGPQLGRDSLPVSSALNFGNHPRPALDCFCFAPRRRVGRGSPSKMSCRDPGKIRTAGRVRLLLGLCLLATASELRAVSPLVTDAADTDDAGKLQLNCDFFFYRTGSTSLYSGQFNPVLG